MPNQKRSLHESTAMGSGMSENRLQYDVYLLDSSILSLYAVRRSAATGCNLFKIYPSYLVLKG